MAATTTRGDFPYPTGGDNAKQVRLDQQRLADRMAVIAALYVEGTAATRPAPGQSGRFHRATDTGVVTLDTGTAWTPITGFAQTGYSSTFLTMGG